jgi:polymerase delta-interacting protein 2
VFDKLDDASSSSTPADVSSHDRQATEEIERNGPPERNKAKKLTYYQVLVDSRDIPYLRSQPESVTFLSGPHANRSVYTINGLDYVSQNDVLPYTSTEKIHIIHELFDKFLFYDLTSSMTGGGRVNLGEIE